MNDKTIKSLLTIGGIQTIPKMKRLHPTEAVMRLVLRSGNLLCGISDEKTAQIRETVLNCYEKKKPITTTITFGGYKNPNLPSTPFANWAEVMNISFMLNTLVKVAEFYPYGVVLEYVLQDLFLDELNNTSQEAVDNYTYSFREIVELFQNKIPASLKIVTKLYRELIDPQEFKSIIKREMDKVKKEWQISEDQTLINAALERARRNLKTLNPTEKEVRESAMFHTAYVRASYYLKYNNPKERLLLVHRKSLKSDHPLIPYRSYKSSTIQFWVGEGVLIKNGHINPTILGATQLKEHKHLFAIENNEFITKNPNLKEISVYEKIES